MAFDVLQAAGDGSPGYCVGPASSYRPRSFTLAEQPARRAGCDRRDHAKSRQLDVARHILDALDRVVEILEKEDETDTGSQAQDKCDQRIRSAPRTDRCLWNERRLDH